MKKLITVTIISSILMAGQTTIYDHKWRWKMIDTRVHSIGIQEDGSLWTWGDNEYGQLGNGTTENELSPVQIGNKKWKVIAVGVAHSIGIQEDGSLWTWGLNDRGQLGDGTREDRLSPVQIGNKKWEYISAHHNFNLGIQEDGTIWFWGTETIFELPHTDIDINDYIKVKPTLLKNQPDKKWKYISWGGGKIMGIQKDGTLWDLDHAKKIGDKKWNYVFADSHDIFGIQEDDTLWGWGDNTFGQLR